MEINFYQVDDLLHKSISSLLIKFLVEKKRAIIYSKDIEILKQVDDGLWSFSKTKFIPHVTIWDKFDYNQQPFLLTNREENVNQSDFLIMLDGVSNDFLAQFSKSFYFFSIANKDQARELWSDYKKQSAKLNFYRKDDNKWIARPMM